MTELMNPSMNRLKSVTWMFAWAASFNMLMAFIKMLQSSNTVTIAFIRFLFALAVLMPAVLKAPATFVRTNNLRLQIVNAVFRSGAIFFTYYAYSQLPIAFAASIGFTGPFIAVILALILLREKVAFHKWIAVFTGYMGVLVMVNPQDASLNIAIGASLLANVCAGLSSVMTKKISATDSTPQIMFYSNIVSVVLFGMILIFTWQTPAQSDWPLIFLIGIAGTISQYAFIQAIRNADISFVAPFEYMRLLFAVPIGVMFFSEYPTPMSILGALIIMASSGFLMFKEFQAQKSQQLKATA
jgi:drug/metabolite transporter (DMT)-like permease